jgi:S-adenosyl-L-methionine hydrolase (adenosine-forming)
LSYITLITDFGLKDGNVGVMKGVIWGITPLAQIADLSHNISPQNIPEAALILLRSAPFFPAGTVHLVVVDPGVGTERRPIAARLGEQFFVGPDNGVLTMLLELAEKGNWGIEIVHTDKPAYWLPEISHVFHGRDIFAPVAAHLARGVPLGEVGTPIDDPVRLNLPQPERRADGWRGQVIHIDHFGNISTNIRRQHLGKPTNVKVSLCGVVIEGLVETFGERGPGQLITLYGSTGNLIISVVNGNAALKLGATVGDSVKVELQGP